jgi:endonuclease/exonuclease/phosphatase family metal-dependent hydrolase
LIIKLLSYNIRFGGVGREEKLAQVIRTIAPDIVVFQEATHTRVIEQLAVATDMPFHAAKKQHSIAYISRLQIAYHEWHYTIGNKHPYMEIVPQDSKTRIFGLHLRARLSKWDERRRAAEIRALLKNIERHKEGFHVLVGDFNTLAPGELLNTQKMPQWLRALVWISGRDIQRETVKIMLDGGYADSYRSLHPEVKGYTFPTWDPHIRFDYVFTPANFMERIKSCQVIDNKALASAASDHFPLLVQLDIAD